MSDAETESPYALARRARAATGLSQAAFGRLLGVSTATVSAWEQERRQPTPKRLAKVLLRLVASRPDWCLEELGAETPPRGPLRREGGVEARVLRACKQLAQGPAQRVSLDKLRAALDDVERRLIDEGLLRLERDGKVRLRAALFPAQLSETEQEALIETPMGDEALFVDVVPG